MTTNDETHARQVINEQAAIIDTVRVAFETISEALGDIQSVYEVGFTCSEAEALYEAMVAVGATDQAEHFMTWHSTLDDPDEGDIHRPVYGAEYPDFPVGFERIDLEDLV